MAHFLCFVFFCTTHRAGEGHVEIVKLLCESGADPNCEDRWGRRPLDDAASGEHEECQRVLKLYGAELSEQATKASDELDTSTKRTLENMKVNFDELELIDRIGAGAFGEIYKCRYVEIYTLVVSESKSRFSQQSCPGTSTDGEEPLWRPKLSRRPKFGRIGSQNRP
jgi:hypothetical protein